VPRPTAPSVIFSIDSTSGFHFDSLRMSDVKSKTSSIGLAKCQVRRACQRTYLRADPSKNGHAGRGCGSWKRPTS
jgi:hypothetical protein